ncbi:Caspase-1-A [Orchesella cincta]|uniref:Caspase-1-A n=1 Tax=Orchesella cincta TaxID=48709 RepID=A0A1D2MVE4_ORCCI|nr:Caspase-1-A [Orchesella cincta]
MASPWEREVYKVKKFELCQTIVLEDKALLIELESKNLIKKWDTDSVIAELKKEGSMGAVNKLLNILDTKTDGFDKLMIALKDLGQTGPHKTLLNGKKEHEPQSKARQQAQPLDELPSNTASTSTQVHTAENEPLKRKRFQEDEDDDPKRIRLIVQRPHTAMKFPGDFYGLPQDWKGYFIAINVISYDACDNRDSAKIDTDRLISVTFQIGYETYKKDYILKKNYWTAEQIIEELKEFRDQAIRADAPSIFVFLGGHGTDGNIIASDGKPVHIWKDILSMFNTKNCKELQNKPKIFMFQACQNFGNDIGDEDDAYPPCFDHFVILKATIPGFAAKRNKSIGSVMVHYFTEVIRTNARRWSFQEMINAVQSKVQNYEYAPKQTDLAEGNFIEAQTMDVQMARLKPLYFNLEPQVENN